jgi:hypothetical protein
MLFRVSADVAQPVEQLIRNQQVRGSIPRVGSNKNKGLSEKLSPLIFSMLPYSYPLTETGPSSAR